MLMTVLFTDIVDSTEAGGRAGRPPWRELLDGHDDGRREEVARYRGPRGEDDRRRLPGDLRRPARGCGAPARSRCRAAARLEVRAGLHTGECETAATTSPGSPSTSARGSARLAGPGEVLVTSTVKDLVVGSEIEFEDHGEHTLKGVPGDWAIFRASP